MFNCWKKIFNYYYYFLGADTDLDSDDAKEALLAYQTGGMGRIGGPVLAVEVKDGKHGSTHVWSMDKLKSVKLHY